MKKISDLDNLNNEIKFSLKKVGINKTKNIFITSNLKEMSKIRLKKNQKLEALYENIVSLVGENFSLFSPAATLELCNTKEIFDIKNTKTTMGSFAEFLRKKSGSVRSLHPYWSINGLGKLSKNLKKVSTHSYGVGSPWSVMLDNDFIQLNIGINPERAVTLIHHIECVCGAPYRFNKEFIHKIKLEKKIYEKKFYMSVSYKNTNIKKKYQLNKHYFKELKNKKKLKYFKSKNGIEFWSFKMRDFYDVSKNFFIKDINNYLEFPPNLNLQNKL